jgi:PhoH-like ATPase
MRDDIKLVFAIGFAGTGKTLLSIASGLSQVLIQKYKKMVITRSHVPMGRDLGYLPGNLNEKLEPWLKPIYDNMELILDNISEDKQPVSKDNALLKKHMNELTLDYLKSTKFIEVEAINFIRGRTFHDSFLIIDEAQNLTPHEVKTIITRAGQNTKIVLTGDPSQIDNPYLDEKDNGLVYSSERFKKNKSKIAVTVILDRCERSEIAQEASDFLV